MFEECICKLCSCIGFYSPHYCKFISLAKIIIVILLFGIIYLVIKKMKNK